VLAMATPGSELKFRRAEHHLAEVHDLLRDYLNPPPYAIRRDENSDLGLSFWITLDRTPPDEIALAAGDCIHNLRAALDHVIYELGCQHTQQQHVKGTAFPILSDPTSWDATDKAGKLLPSSGLHKLSAVPDRARDSIKLLQPYDKAKDALFWQREGLLQLHRLDIADKHRNLNLAVVEVPDLSGVLFLHDGAPPKTRGYLQGRLEKAEEALLLGFHPTVDLDTKVQPIVFMNVAFVDPPVEGLEVQIALRNLVWCTRTILSGLRTFF
jgi:hypothetical protein